MAAPCALPLLPSRTTREVVSAASVAHPDSVRRLAACSLPLDTPSPRHRRPPPAQFQEVGDWQPSAPARFPEPRRVVDRVSGPGAGCPGSPGDRREPGHQGGVCAPSTGPRPDPGIERAAYFPTLTAGPSATRSRTSVNSPLYSPTKPTIGNDFLLEADLSYEIDVWGRIRNSVAPREPPSKPALPDLATLDLSTHAELASDYFRCVDRTPSRRCSIRQSPTTHGRCS